MIKSMLALLAFFMGTSVVAQERPVMGYPNATNSVQGTCDPAQAKYQMIGGGIVPGVGSTNEGSFTSIGITQVEMSGFRLNFIPDASTSRFMIDIYANGTTPLVDDFYATGTHGVNIFFPIAIPAGTNIQIRFRSNSASRMPTATILGQVRMPGCPAGFNRAEALNNDPANTRVGISVITNNDTYNELVSATNKTYSALLISAGTSNVVPTLGGVGVYTVGKGPAGSETYLGSGLVSVSTSNGILHTGGVLLTGVIPQGTRIAGKITTPTNTDTSRMGVMGIY